jgi:hypothetical protein
LRRTVERIRVENPNDVQVVRCPKCHRLAGTPRITWCPRCDYRWSQA